VEQYQLEALERIVTRPRETYHTITVEPLTPVIGAEVSQVDLARELSDAQLDDLRRAFLANHVLVFRDQKLSLDQHKRLAMYFGELRAFDEEADPHVVEIKTTKDSRFIAGEDWHVDGSADAEPSLGSMLDITRTPDLGCGGDTLFSNMHLAYELLSPAMKSFLENLTAVHDGLVPWKGYPLPPGYVVARSEHPVVVRHPETGRRLLYVNGGYTTRITQLAPHESTAVLTMLLDSIAKQPMITCRVRWTPNTLVFWDNRCVQHHAIWDYFPHARFGQRVTINGTRPQA
jgi:taurine dioxygenase